MKLNDRTVKKHKIWIFALLLLWGINHSFLCAQAKQTVDFTSSNLPIVTIDTHGQTIPYDDPRIVADMGIIYNGAGQRNRVSDPPNNYSGKISMEIHGQSSAGWDKKSYNIETQNNDGSNRNVSLIDLPEENDWVLYAPYYDRSLMRNVLTYDLARKMGWYAPRTRYCELILNGVYQGVYVLTEKIKRDKNRVNINKLKPDEISGDDVTGGYLLRIDKEPWKDGFDSPYPPFAGSDDVIRYQYRYPKAKDIVPEQVAYIKRYVLTFENIMHDSVYSDPETGYAKYINVASFIDNVLVNELSRNVDGYRLSAYFYKDKDSNGGKLTAGPVWDYNFSFGNAGYYDSWLTAGWQLLYFADNTYFHQVDGFFMPFWWKLLFQDRAFSQRLHTRWQELRGTHLSADSLFASIDRWAAELNEAQQRNFEIWPGPGETDLGSGWFPDDPRHSQIHSYADEIYQLKQWISGRMSWIDDNISKITAMETSRHYRAVADFELEQNFPNPFNPATVIGYRLSVADHVTLTVYNVLGQKMRVLKDTWQKPGRYSVRFNADNFPGGVYIYVLNVGKRIRFRKMVVLH